MKKLSILLLVIVAAVVSCKKTPEVNLKYVDVERELITVGVNIATVQCDYQYITTLKKAFFYYGEGANETDMGLAEMRVVQNTLYVDLTGLKENTTYSYYYEFVNGFNSMRSETKTFKTEASPIVPPEITLPTVVTAMVTEITTNSAMGGGEVTDDGGAEVTERGICWSSNVNPTLSDNHISAGSGMGLFTALMDGLEANTTYHARAYAINEKGTAYGLDREFATLVYVPEGAINGLFTINDQGDQVYFSQGNLQYQASTNTWRFAENQWDYVGTQVSDYFGCYGGTVIGSDNHNISPTYSGWIDLFGWGTSGYNHGAVCYQPWSTDENHDNYVAYGIALSNLNDQSGMADWGYNAISNGGNTENMWRTLTNDEFVYILVSRNTNSGIRYAKSKVGDVYGLIILPDDWNVGIYNLVYTNTADASFTSNIINATEWSFLESAGAIFLPVTGARNGFRVFRAGCGVLEYCAGHYLTATSDPQGGEGSACAIIFSDENLVMSISGEVIYADDKAYGHAVRLVHDAYR